MKIYVKKVTNTKGEVKEWLWIEFYDNNNERQRKSLKLLNTPANMKKAELVKAKLLLRIEDGKFIEKKIPTLDEYKKLSFEMNEGTRSATTQNDYRISYDKHISPSLGHMKLDEIKPSHVRLWQTKLLKVVSPRRVRNIRAVLSGILRNAMEDEIIDKNPISIIRGVKLEKTVIHPFSMEEISLILQNSQGQHRNFFALAFMSGMRSGEMIGLKWSDINFFKSEITIKRSRKMGIDGKTKTVSSNRTIDIVDDLLPWLKNQYQLTGANSSYVFLNNKNEAIYDIKRIRETTWKKTLKDCGLDYRPIYHTRHSFATTMIEGNEDILWVSNMLGHTSPAMTYDRYTRYIKKDSKKRGVSFKVISAPNDTEIGTELLKIA